MPLISAEALHKKIAEQQTEILALKELVTELRFCLENQHALMRVRELGVMINDFPEKLDNPIIASLNLH